MYREAIAALLPDVEEEEPDEQDAKALERRRAAAEARKALAIRAGLGVLRFMSARDDEASRAKLDRRIAPAVAWLRKPAPSHEEDARRRRDVDARRRPARGDEAELERAVRYLYLLVASAPEHARGYLGAVCDAAVRRIARRDLVRDPGTVTAAVAGVIASTPSA